MSKSWAELTSNLESVSTERLLGLYLWRFRLAVANSDTETEEQIARDCEPILAEARRRDAELAALRPFGAAAVKYGRVTDKHEFDIAAGELITTAVNFARAQAPTGGDHA